MAEVKKVLVWALCSLASARAADAQLDVREQSLGMWPDSIVSSASSYSMRVAYVVRTATGMAVVLDGVEGPSFTDIPHRVTEAGASPNLSFSYDGERLAYHAHQGKQMVAVVDGRIGPPYDAVRWAFGGARDAFTRDSRHSAYLATLDGKTQLVIDGVAGRPYDEVRGIVYSPRGPRFIYVARRDGRSYLVVNGAEVDEGPQVATAVLSESGDHVAFTIQRDGALAHVVKRGDQELMVTGTREGPRYDRIYPVYYRKDGKVTYIGTREDQQFVVVDSTVFAFDQVAGVYPVNNPIAISGRRGTGWYVIVDGKTTGPYTQAVNWVVDSRDGRRLAYIAARAGQQFAVIDGVEGRSYDEVRWLNFSLDGRHVFFLARRLDKWSVVVDGEESPAYTEILSMSPINFMSNESFKMLARRGREDLRVTVSWPKR